MNDNDSNIGIEEIIAALQSDDRKEWALSYLKNTSSEDEEIIGLRLFMEQNNYNIEALERYLNAAKLDYQKSKVTSSRQSFQWLRIAAMFAIIISIVVGAYLYFTPKNYYEQYAFHEPGLQVFMSANSDKKIGDWMTEFKADNFEVAQKMGESLLLQDPFNDTLLYYQGVIYSKQGNYTLGIESFEKVSELNMVLHQKSQYLLALCWMQHDKEKAEKLLLQIAEDSLSKYANAAQEILKKEF